MKEIKLTNSPLVAMVDDNDFDLVSGYNWKVSVYGYACRRWKGKTIFLHRFVMGVRYVSKRKFDHADRNKLNCQKHNLRDATYSQNSANVGKLSSNTSGYKGVCWYKKMKQWGANIGANGRTFHLGTFDDKILAAIAYDDKAIEFHGEFACLNFLLYGA